MAHDKSYCTHYFTLHWPRNQNPDLEIHRFISNQWNGLMWPPYNKSVNWPLDPAEGFTYCSESSLWMWNGIKVCPTLGRAFVRSISAGIHSSKLVNWKLNSTAPRLTCNLQLKFVLIIFENTNLLFYSKMGKSWDFQMIKILSINNCDNNKYNAKWNFHLIFIEYWKFQ